MFYTDCANLKGNTYNIFINQECNESESCLLVLPSLLNLIIPHHLSPDEADKLSFRVLTLLKCDLRVLNEIIQSNYYSFNL